MVWKRGIPRKKKTRSILFQYPMDPWPLSEKVQRSLQIIVNYTQSHFLRRYDWIFISIGNVMIRHQTFAGRLNFSGRAVSHVLGICLGWTVCVWTFLVIWNGSQYRIMVKIVVIKSVKGHHIQEYFDLVWFCYGFGAISWLRNLLLLSNPSMTSYHSENARLMASSRVIHPQLGMLFGMFSIDYFNVIL